MLKKIKYGIVCILISAVLISTCTGLTYSATVSELNSQKEDVQNKIDNAEKELEEIEATMDEVEKQVSQLSTQIAYVQGDIDELSVEISQNEEKLAKAQADYEKRNEIFINRIISQYETGDVTYLDMLLGAESLTDFISNYYLIAEMADMDVSLLNEIEQTKKEIEETKAKLEQDKAELDAQMDELETKKSERQTYINQLSADKQELQAQREAYDQELEELKSKINELSRQDSVYIGSGVMAWPVPGYTYITDYYGYRIHPIYFDWRLHTGIDIGAPTGANFVAAESGTVILSDWYGGYGRCVIIDHGGGISTLYGHGSEFLVDEGEYVTKGTPVLCVGSSGNSTGPHAHFEVRINGVTVDPLPYIT